ncbi:MAG: hypothetical protein PHW95_00485 [Patescibacteria group bacterium]|nr:hypothetical protein [Patescibacteria group bacterium]
MFERFGRMIDRTLAEFWGWYSKQFWLVQICLALFAIGMIAVVIGANLICQISFIGALLLPISYLTIRFLQQLAIWLDWQMEHPKRQWGIVFSLVGYIGVLFEPAQETPTVQVLYWYTGSFTLILLGWTINRLPGFSRRSNLT